MTTIHGLVLELLDLHIAGVQSMPLRLRLWTGLRAIAERHAPGDAATLEREGIPPDWCRWCQTALPCPDLRDLAEALGVTEDALELIGSDLVAQWQRTADVQADPNAVSRVPDKAVEAKLVEWLRNVLNQLVAEHRLTQTVTERDGREVLLYAPPWLSADIQVKLAILDEHKPYDVADTGSPHCGVCMRVDGGGWRFRPSPCQTVRLLASPFADRPGYREEWKP